MTDEKLKSHFADLRQHFDISIESVRHEVQLVAEGLSVFREKHERAIARLDDKIDRRFAETKALITFSRS